MAFGFDPSLILAASRPREQESPGSQIRALFEQRGQEQMRQATLADMLRKREQETRLADLVRQSAGQYSDPIAAGYARGGFGEQARAAEMDAVRRREDAAQIKKLQMETLRGRAAAVQSPEAYAQFYGSISPEARSEYGFGEQYNPKQIRAFVEAGRQPQFIAPIQAYDASGNLNLVDPKTGRPRPVEGMVKPNPAGDRAEERADKNLRTETAALRKEINSNAEVKKYRKASAELQSLRELAKDGSGASDMAIVFAFMKAMDPESVVRESEYAAAESRGRPDERMMGLVKRYWTGGALVSGQKQAFIRAAQAAQVGHKANYDNQIKTFRYAAEKNGYDLGELGIGDEGGGLSDEKRKRLEELRAKKAAGALR